MTVGIPGCIPQWIGSDSVKPSSPWFRIHCRIFPNPLFSWSQVQYFSPPNNIFLQARQRKNRKFLHKGRSSVKGTVSRDGYFFEGLNIFISTFCVCAHGFQSLSQAFQFCIHLVTFYLLLLLTNFENAYWNPPQNSLLCDCPMFSSAEISLAARRGRARINLSQAAFINT